MPNSERIIHHRLIIHTPNSSSPWPIPLLQPNITDLASLLQNFFFFTTIDHHSHPPSNTNTILHQNQTAKIEDKTRNPSSTPPLPSQPLTAVAFSISKPPSYHLSPITATSFLPTSPPIKPSSKKKKTKKKQEEGEPNNTP